MAHTLAAVFEQRDLAEKARQKLIASGFGSEKIRLNDTASDYSGSPSTSAVDAARDDEGVVASIRHFFSDLFGAHDDRHVYAEAVTRGHVVLTLEAASDTDVDRATDILEDFGPLNIDEQGEQWRAGGLTGSGSGIGRDSSLQGSASMQSQSQAGGFSQHSMPPEQGLQSGAPGAGTTQQAAPASRQFANDDALPPDSEAGSAARTGNVRSYPRTDNLPGNSYDDEQYYRNHWSSNYVATGGRYEDYDPAYRYGRSMAGSDTYRGRSWDDVESDLRSNWEHTYPESAWENFKAAVRHGWDRLTN